MRFFLDIRDGRTVIRDPDGTDFTSLDAARAEALVMVRRLLADGIRSGLDMWNKRLEVCDRTDEVLAVVPFAPIFEMVVGGNEKDREVRSHLRAPPRLDTTARRSAEHMRLALALRLALRNAPRMPGLSGHQIECLAIDPDLASDAATALEDAARETKHPAETDETQPTEATAADVAAHRLQNSSHP